MNIETCLEIQAYVDGELNATRRAAVERLCATQPEARQLSDELTALRNSLCANEPQYQVPETREFYWSQIQRRLPAAEKVSSGNTLIGSSWVRWLAPLAGLAAVVALVTLPHPESPATTTLASLSPSPSSASAASSVVYRSDADGVTVHWIN